MRTTIQTIFEKIEGLQADINELKEICSKMQENSDANDFYIREMIDALTETVDCLLQ